MTEALIESILGEIRLHTWIQPICGSWREFLKAQEEQTGGRATATRQRQTEA